MPGAKEFLENLKSLLYKSEAEYSLILGLAELKLNSSTIADDYRYIIIYEDSDIIGGCLVTQKDLVVTNIPESFILLLAKFLHAHLLKFPGVIGPSKISESFARAWSQVSGIKFQREMSQKIYKLEEVQFPANTNGRLEVATHSYLDLVAEWLYQFTSESLPYEITTIEKAKMHVKNKIDKGEVILWLNENNIPASMNFISRPTKNGISINAVSPTKRGTRTFHFL